MCQRDWEGDPWRASDARRAFLEFAQVFIQSTEALLPDSAVALDPVGNVFQSRWLQPARPPLGTPTLRDETGALEDLEVFGDRGQAELEGLGELEDGAFALGQ